MDVGTIDKIDSSLEIEIEIEIEIDDAGMVKLQYCAKLLSRGKPNERQFEKL